MNEVSSPPLDLTSQGDNARLDLTGGEGIWDPTFIRVKAGAKVTLTINGGIFIHNFKIDALNVTKDVPMGTKATVVVSLPTSGPVIFYCSIHPPMKGAFYFS